MSATATMAHPDRLMLRERPPAPVRDVDLAVEQLAALLAGSDGDQLEALEAVARAAQRLARTRRREVRLEEERPVPMMGSWSLDNGMVTNVVLGEN
ncbi:MAG TPA: hypothetical protein VGL20_13330 [Candidatus Dormibacteraeota bacterium]